MSAADPKTPLESANWLQRWTYGWMDALLWRGFQRPLEFEDLDGLPRNRRADTLFRNFNTTWTACTAPEALKRGHGCRGRVPVLIRALWAAFGREMAWSGWNRLVGDLIAVLSPLLLLAITDFLAQSSLGDTAPPVWHGYMMAVGLFLLQLVQNFVVNKSFQQAMMFGFSVRAATIAAMFQKSLKLSQHARLEFTASKIMNLMSTDSNRLDMACQFFHFIWSSPIQMFIATGLLVWQLGWPAFAGCALILVTIPFQIWVAERMKQLRMDVGSISDVRVRMTQEAIQGIKVIKVYAWEQSIMEAVSRIRMTEMNKVRLMLVLRAVVAGFLQTVPILAAILSFILYTVSGNALTASKAYACLALFYVLRLPLLLYPTIISQVSDARVAIIRIQELLLAEEISDEPRRLPNPEPSLSCGRSLRGGVRVFCASFVWDSTVNALNANHNNPTTEPVMEMTSLPNSVDVQNTIGRRFFTGLHDIDIQLPPGCLCAVVGHVGSGKSSLLSGLIGEIRRVKGDVDLMGSVAYCSQSAWIQNLTLRDNILFGRIFDEQKYWTAIRACAMERDLEVLPSGDMTEIGEKGVNLSGGQKQRVNLARAVYNDADTILLDDPLSAVDAHVGSHLFEECIRKVLAGKTRLLVTHRLHILPMVDRVIVMDNGRIVEQGTFEDLMKNGKHLLALMEGIDHASTHTADRHKSVEKQPGLFPEQHTLYSPAKATERGKLVQKEGKDAGQVGLESYSKYIHYLGGVWVTLGILTLLIISQAARIATDYWLNVWVNKSVSNFSERLYEEVYIGLGVFQSASMVIVSIVSVVVCSVASFRIHELAIGSVFRAPMGWFDSQLMGRIMNRFSRDQDTVDALLPDSIRVFLLTFGMTMSILIYICVIFPWFVIPMVPTLVIYYLAQKYYRRTSVELKRLDNVSRSPLFAHFGETLTGSGLATIRAYHEEQRFVDRNVDLIDFNNRAYHLVIQGQRWISLRLECLAALLIFFAALFGILFRRQINPGLTALSITYALQVTFIFNWAVKQAIESEMYMNSVERLIHYIDHLPNENDFTVSRGSKDDKSHLVQVLTEPPTEWPPQGRIVIENISLKYRVDLPDVLRDITFTIEAGQKVGIVGRTGAGKSSLIYALFLLTRPHHGRIRIDGVDCAGVPLRTLRQRLSIIPQDPVIFTGTLKSNLDPFGIATDADIWQCLERCGLVEAVDPEAGLNMTVSEGGENWSMGQRQLICLARAMLKKSRILVLDEATASVDMATDALIQRTLRQHFQHATILTIAHRLNTIMDYDQIVVLGQGRVLEVGTPADLLTRKPQSVFKAMVAEMETAQSAILRD